MQRSTTSRLYAGLVKQSLAGVAFISLLLAAGLPVVASDVNANRLYIRDGENGFLVGTLGDWEARMARLIEDPDLRAIVGAKARALVQQEYSISSAVPRYLKLFDTLITSKSESPTKGAGKK